MKARSEEAKPKRKYLLKRLWLLVPGAVALLLTWLAASNQAATEVVYSEGVFPVLSTAVGFLPSLVSFSVAQWVVVAFLLFVVAYLVYWIVAIVRRKGKRLQSVYRCLVGALGVVSVAFCCFALTGGLNYYRLTFAETAGFELTESDVSELETLCWGLAASMNEERAALGEGFDACTLEPGDFEDYSHRAADAVQALAQSYPCLEHPLYSPPKPVLFSELLSDSNIAGMYFPFTEESNVNTQSMLFSQPATMCHELAHQCGFMREDEANFIAYLACLRTDDALMRYSGYTLAYDYAMGALRRADPDAAKEVAATLSDAVMADRRTRSEFWAAHEGPLNEASTKMNDAYLKANNQTDGVQSYGRMVDLLLAEQRREAAGD